MLGEEVERLEKDLAKCEQRRGDVGRIISEQDSQYFAAYLKIHNSLYDDDGVVEDWDGPDI